MNSEKASAASDHHLRLSRLLKPDPERAILIGDAAVNLFSGFVRDYMARHTNPWNRALHLVGVPLAPIIFLYLLVRGHFAAAAAAFAAGYALQWIGHRIEGNSMWDSLEGKLIKALALPFRLVRSHG
jgi:hypothetical protein